MAPYIAWAVFYYLKLFVVSSKKIRDRGYETLYKYMLEDANFTLLKRIVFKCVTQIFSPNKCDSQICSSVAASCIHVHSSVARLSELVCLHSVVEFIRGTLCLAGCGNGLFSMEWSLTLLLLEAAYLPSSQLLNYLTMGENVCLVKM